MKITAKQLVENDAFRNAFNSLTRVIAPMVNQNFMYWSDIMYDAILCTDQETGESVYIVVNDCGTHSAMDMKTARELVKPTLGIAILKVTRGKYDRFNCEIITRNGKEI